MNARAKKTQMLLRVTALATCLAFAGPSQAERTYKWVDRDGNVHYSNRLPPVRVMTGRFAVGLGK